MLARTLQDAVVKATKLCRKDGRLRYIFIGSLGYGITLRRPMEDCYWTNGLEAGSWSSDHRSGIRDSDIEDLIPIQSV